MAASGWRACGYRPPWGASDPALPCHARSDQRYADDEDRRGEGVEAEIHSPRQPAEQGQAAEDDQELGQVARKEHLPPAGR